MYAASVCRPVNCANCIGKEMTMRGRPESRPRTWQWIRNRGGRTTWGMVVGEDGGDGGRSAGAAVGAALGGGGGVGGGVGGSEWGKGGEAMRWVARVDLRVEWASEVVCATWEEIQRGQAGALGVCVRCVGIPVIRLSSSGASRVLGYLRMLVIFAGRDI